MKNNKKIYVQLQQNERKYFKIYFDFLYNKLLTGEEKFIFIILKSFINFSNDNNGVQGEVYPSMQTICDITGYGNKKVIKILHGLKSKGIIKIVHRGLTQSNLYTLADYPAMWACDNIEDVKAIVDNQGRKPLTPSEHIAELERMGYKVEIKEKGLESDSDQTAESSTTTTKNYAIHNEQNTTDKPKSQDLERYTLDQIKQLFSYDAMVHDNPNLQQDIDSVMDILHTAMNTTKPTIRVSGEDKPSMAVIGKLMKLHKESIMYAIGKYQEQTERIKNPLPYMLAILYNAPEQYRLDMQNRASHDMAHWKEPSD